MEPFSLLADRNSDDYVRQIMERDLGPQPLARVMAIHGLKAKDLVEASTDQLNHKMVARACKGRRLTPNVKVKVREALIAASGESNPMTALFNY